MKQEVHEFIRVNKPIENPSVGNGCESNRPKTGSKNKPRMYGKQSNKDRYHEDPKAFISSRNDARKVQAENARIKYENRIHILLG